MDARAWRYTGLQIAIIGLESVWIALAALVLSPAGAVGAGPLFGAGVLALLWNRWLLARSWWDSGAGRMLGLVGLGVIVVAIGWAGEPDVMRRAAVTSVYAERVAIMLGSRGLLVAWLVGLVLMARVVLLLRAPLTFLRVIGRIRTSAILSLTALLLLHGIVWNLRWVVAGLVVCALFALPLVRAVELSRESGAGGLPFTGRWVGTLLMGVGLVVIVGLGVDAPLESRHFTVVYALLGVLQTIVAYILAGVLELIFHILFPIVKWLVDFYKGIVLDVLLPFLDFLVNGRIAVEGETRMIDPRILQALSVGLVVVTFLIPVLAIWQMYRLLKVGLQAEGATAETEELAMAASWYEWWKARQDELRRLWAKWFRHRFGIDTVRDLYKNLLLFGDAHHLPRPTANTPYEYLEPLCTRYPMLVPEFHALTDAYVAVRYGEHDFTDNDIRRLQRSWERIAAYREERGEERGKRSEERQGTIGTKGDGRKQQETAEARDDPTPEPI